MYRKNGSLSQVTESHFSDNAELRFDVSEFGGILAGQEDDITVYSRPQPGTGPFTALPTTFDAGTGELVADTDGFSEFVFASDSNPLPVELTSFSATVGEDAVHLTWATATETNNAGFDVQRRVGAETREGAAGPPSATSRGQARRQRPRSTALRTPICPTRPVG